MISSAGSDSLLLFPEAFGIMALVSVVLVGLAMFSDVGIGPAISQHKRGDDAAFLDTAWTINVVRGAALWGVRPMAALGAWLVLVASGAGFAGPVGAVLVGAVLGGGGLLVAASWLLMARRRATT